MTTNRNKRTSDLKLKIAVEALKGEKTINQLASFYGVHPRQVTRWRDQLLKEGELIFKDKNSLRKAKVEPDKEDLLHIIDQLTAELDFLKKKLGGK